MSHLRRALLGGSCLLFLVIVCCARVQTTARVPFESLRCPDSGMACDFVVGGGIGCCAHGADGSAATWMCPSGLGGRVVSQPQPVAGLIGAVHVEVLGESLCARLADGTVRCYGSNDRAGLGLGRYRGVDTSSPTLASCADADCEELEPRALCEGTAVAVPVVGVDAATALFGRCVLQRDELLCWGDNSHGELRGVRRGAAIPVATPVGGFGGEVSSVDGMCAVYGEDGRVGCWGDASSSPVNGGVGVEQLAMESPYGGAGCALIYGRVHCWGRENTNEVVQVAGLGRALQVGAKGGSACALLEDETVSCWGRNGHGQLGDGTTHDRDWPVRVSGLSDVKQIQVGLFRACARLGDGGVACWGSLPTDEGNADHPTPVRIAGLPPALRLALGGNTLCAITESTQVYCWGNIFAPEDPVVRERGVVSAIESQAVGEPIAEDVTPLRRPRLPITCSTESVYCSGASCYPSEDECLDIRARSKPLAASCERRETTYVDARSRWGGRLCACREGRCRRCYMAASFEQCQELPPEVPCGSPDWDTGDPVPDTELATRCGETKTLDLPSKSRSRYCANGAISVPRSCPPPPPDAGNDYCPPEWVEEERCFRTANACESFRAESAEHLPDATEPECRLIAP